MRTLIALAFGLTLLVPASAPAAGRTLVATVGAHEAFTITLTQNGKRVHSLPAGTYRQADSGPVRVRLLRPPDHDERQLQREVAASLRELTSACATRPRSSARRACALRRRSPCVHGAAGIRRPPVRSARARSSRAAS